MKNKTIDKLLSSHSISILGAIFIALTLMVNTIRAIDSNYSLQAEVDKLSEEIAILELENAYLEVENQYYDTDAFIEYEARRRLNKYAEGESRIVLPKYEIPAAEQGSEPEEDNRPGYQKNLDSWWGFFFGSS